MVRAPDRLAPAAPDPGERGDLFDDPVHEMRSVRSGVAYRASGSVMRADKTPPGSNPGIGPRDMVKAFDQQSRSGQQHEPRLRELQHDEPFLQPSVLERASAAARLFQDAG